MADDKFNKILSELKGYKDWQPYIPKETIAPKEEQSAFSRGLGETIPQLKQSVYGLAGLAGNIAENKLGVGEDLAKWGYKNYLEKEKEISALQKDDETLSGLFNGSSNVGRTLGRSLGYTVGQGLESLAFAAGGGLIGGLLGSPAPVVGNAGGAVTGAISGVVGKQGIKELIKQGVRKYGAYAGLSANSGIQEGGQIYGDAVKNNNGELLDNRQLAKVAGTAALATGLDTLTGGIGLNRAINARGLAGGLGRIGEGIIGEGITESAQTALERYGAGREVTSQEGVKDLLESGLQGAFGGGVISSGIEVKGTISKALDSGGIKTGQDKQVETPSENVAQPDEIKNEIQKPLGVVSKALGLNQEAKINAELPLENNRDNLVVDADGVITNLPVDEPKDNSILPNYIKNVFDNGDGIRVMNKDNTFEDFSTMDEAMVHINDIANIEKSGNNPVEAVYNRKIDYFKNLIDDVRSRKHNPNEVARLNDFIVELKRDKENKIKYYDKYIKKNANVELSNNQPLLAETQNIQEQDNNQLPANIQENIQENIPANIPTSNFNEGIKNIIGEEKAKNVIATNKDNLINLGVTPLRAKNTEGFYNPVDKKVYIVEDNIKPTKNSTVEQRVAWITHHELFHAGIEKNNKYKATLALARTNPIVKNIAKSLQKQKGITDSNLAIEEALGEISGAIGSKNIDALQKQYGVKINVDEQNNFLNNVAKSLKSVIAKVANVDSVKMSTAEVLDFVNTVSTDTTELNKVKKETPIAEDNAKERPEVGLTQSNNSPDFSNPLIQRDKATSDRGMGNDNGDLILSQAPFDGKEQAKTKLDEGAFDSSNEDIRFSTAPEEKYIGNTSGVVDKSLKEVKSTIGVLLEDIAGTDNKFSLLAKSVNSQFHKSKINPLYKQAFELSNNLIETAQTKALEASAIVQGLLPQYASYGNSAVEVGKAILSLGQNIRAKKSDIHTASRAIHLGTLKYTRNKKGQLIETDNPKEAGVVFTDAELRYEFNASPKQILLYRQSREAINYSIDTLSTSLIYATARKVNIDISKDINDIDNAIEDVITQLADSKLSTDVKSSVITDIYEIEKIANRSKERGYAPIMRYGKHSVIHKVGNKIISYQLFESRKEALKEAEVLRNEHPNDYIQADIISEKEHEIYQGISTESLELFANYVAKGMPDGKRQIIQSFIAKTTNNRSELKRKLERSGYEGYSDDLIRNLTTFITSNARAASRNYYLKSLDEAVVNIKNYTKDDADGMNKYRSGDILDEAILLRNYVIGSEEEASALRGWLYTNYIAGSIASAAINVSSIPLMTIPYLSQYADNKQVAENITRYSVVAAKSVIGKGYKIENAEVAKAYKMAVHSGALAPNEYYQLQALSQSSSAKNIIGQHLLKLWSGAFGVTESFNRHLTWLSAYDIATNMEKGKLEKLGYNSIDDFAVNAVRETQLIYNKANRPNWARGKVGALLFTFKMFSIGYLELLTRLPNKQKAIMLGMLVFLGGIKDLPFSDDLNDLIDTLGQMLGYNTQTARWRKQVMNEFLGKTLADVVERGVLNLSGIEVSSRIGISNVVPASGLFKKSEPDKMKQFSEILGVGGNYFYSLAQMAGGDKNVKDVLPVGIGNLFRAYEMAATGEYRDAKGNKVANVNLYDAAMKAVGFMPTAVTDARRTVEYNKQMVDYARKYESNIINKIAVAIIDKDDNGIKDAISDLKDWNAKNADSQIAITKQQVIRAVKQKRGNTESRYEKTVPKEIRGNLVK